MRPAHVLLFFILQTVSISLLAQLDNTFSGNGQNSIKIGSGSYGSAVIIQPVDQKIVMAGNYNNGYGTNTNFGAVRLLTNGTLDPGFGSGGKAALPFGLNTSGAVGVAMQSDTNILLVGDFYPTPGDQRITTLVRLTPEGQLDLSFSPTGYIEIPYPIMVKCLLVQPDGKILVGGEAGGAGYCVARYTKGGVLDPSWGSGGVASVAGDGAEAMALQPDGGVVAVGIGYGNNSMMMAVRFTKTGVPDPQFGTNGITNITIDGRDVAQGFGVGLQSDGYVLLVGQYLPAVTNPQFRALVVRLRPDGTLDPGFAGNGKLGVPFSGGDASAFGVIELSGGQIIVGGYVHPTSGNDKFALCRVTVNGAIDYSFGPGGWLTTSWPNVSAAAQALAIQKDGKIIAAGGTGASFEGSGDFAIARYLSPFILPKPPIVTSTNPVAGLTDASASIGTSGLRVFPNPAHSLLQIEGLDAGGPVLMAVTDAAGGTILRSQIDGKTNYSLDIHRLAPGLYFLAIMMNGTHRILPFLRVD